MYMDDTTKKRVAQEWFRENEEKFRDIIENSVDWIWTQDDNGVFTYTSPNITELLGYRPDEIIGKRMADLVPHESTNPIANASALAAAAKRTFRLEHAVLRQDGSLLFLETIGVPVLGIHGENQGFHGISRDISERRRAEEDVRRQTARAEALAHTAVRLYAQLDLDTVLHAVCEKTCYALNAPAAGVALYDVDRKELCLTSSFGASSDWHRLSKPIERAVYDEYTRQMGSPIVIPDLREYPDLPDADLFAMLNVRTIVCASMFREGQLVGCLIVVTFGETRAFAEEELMLLQGLADQAALAIANAMLHKQVRAGHERMRQLSRRVVSAQEEERQRLSRELHDEAGQALTALKISLELIQNDLPARYRPLHHRLSEAIALTDTTMEHIRLLAQNLRPPVLDEVGINLTLADLCREFARRTQMIIQYSGIELSLPNPLGICLYRILQEALTNAAKHGHARRILVTLSRGADMVSLSVEDNGIGLGKRTIDLENDRTMGIGLLGIRERLEVLGGRLEIESRPGLGTCLIACIPWQEAQ